MDAVVGPDRVPEPMDEAVQVLLAAGLPPVIHSADLLAAMNDVGPYDHLGGTAGGECFAAHGVMNV